MCHSKDYKKELSQSEQTSKLMGYKYSVTISGENTNENFDLYKSAEGEWYKDLNNKTPLEDNYLFKIKNAIVKSESEID